LPAPPIRDLIEAMEHQLTELRALAARAKNRLTETGIPHVAMVQGKIPEHELNAVYDPMVNLILQGSKSMAVGNRTLHYSPADYFVMSVGLPAIGTVRPSASGEPYLAVALTLQPSVVANLLADLPEITHGERGEQGLLGCCGHTRSARRLASHAPTDGTTRPTFQRWRPPMSERSSIGCCKGLMAPCCAT
jgi:hypothetical protein